MTTILGAKELHQFLNGLPREFSDPLLQKINTKAAIPLVNKMHRMAPVGLTGNLAASIGVVKSGRNNVGELGQIEIGPRRKGGFKGFAGHFNEFGTKRRRVKKRHPIFGYDRGVMPKRPFLEPAWEQTKAEVLGNITKELGKVVTDFGRATLK